MVDFCVPFNIGCEERQEKRWSEGWLSLQHQKLKVFASSESADSSKENPQIQKTC